MKRTLLLCSILLLSAVWAFAQYESNSGSTQSSTSSTTTSTQSSSDVKTFQGCLSGSEGSYTLTDRSGTVHLTGNTSGLQAHVGHTIQVTGTLASASSTGASSSSGQAGSMSSSTDSQPTLSVVSFKHVAGSCSNAQ